ncbi:hypothetical protein BY996DRAFT_4157484 [Phakopsora pachyrhizi]|nr:hypothetical protein BY996DRAFT_4157484 [Phakopsora pachyrhizi]
MGRITFKRGSSSKFIKLFFIQLICISFMIKLALSMGVFRKSKGKYSKMEKFNEESESSGVSGGEYLGNEGAYRESSADLESQQKNLNDGYNQLNSKYSDLKEFIDSYHGLSDTDRQSYKDMLDKILHHAIIAYGKKLDDLKYVLRQIKNGIYDPSGRQDINQDESLQYLRSKLDRNMSIKHTINSRLTIFSSLE